MDSTARLVVRLFGEAQMTFDGEPWTVWMPPRCLLLLALVSARLDDVPSRASLAAALWPDELDTDARTNLRRHLHVLQRGLPPIDGVEWIAYEGRNLRWNDRAPGWIDVRAFQRGCADPARGAEAAAAYRGELLEGIVDESILVERERLAALHRDLLLRLIHDAREARDHSTAIRYAQDLLAVDEWREDALREWMIGTAQSGERQRALDAFEAFERRLQAEFAASPTAETLALRDAIRSGLPLPDAAVEDFESSLSEPARRAWNLPFVGREDDLTRLRAIWTRAARGNGGTVFVSGEAGIGKSRIVAELAVLAREQGAYVLRGATSDPEASPYQVVLDALRGGMSHLVQVPVQTPWLGVLAQVLPEMTTLLPGIARSEELSGSGARFRLFDAVASAIAHLARLRPLCIVLEDVHWAGPATVDLIEALAQRIGALPVMLLVTYRSEDSTGAHPLRTLRASLVRERRAAAMPLERLGADDVATIVGSVAKRTVDRALDERIAQLSEGNPLFVAQLLEGYRETGTIPDEASALRSAGDAIAVRIERLDREIRSVAQAAAASGQPFRSDVVAEIGGWSESAVLDAVGELMDRSLVGEAGPGYAFSHALVAAAFYREGTPELREDRHRRIAAIFERTRGGEDAALGAIARHWELGGNVAEAARVYVRAARAAGSVFAREEAVAAAHRAYELAADARTRFDAMVEATFMHSGTTNLQRWAADVERFERAAAELGDEERFAAMRARERYACQIVDFTMLEQVVEALDALAARSGEHRHFAYAGYARGYYDMQRGEIAAARAAFSRGLDAAIAAGEPEEIARIREELIGVLLRCGDMEVTRAELAKQEAFVAENDVSLLRRIGLLNIETSVASIAEDGPRLERVAGELLEISTRIGDTYNVAKCHMLMVQSCALRAAFPEMREHRRKASEIFASVGELRGAVIVVLNYAMLELRAGRCDLALQNLHDERDLIGRLNLADVNGIVAMCRAEAFLLLESFEESAAAARAGLEAIAGAGELRFVAEVRTLLGAAEGRLGRYDEAMAHLRFAIATSHETESPHQVAYAASWLIDIACDAGNAADARECAPELQRLFEEERAVLGYPTFVCHALARVAALDSSDDRGGWRATGAQILRERLALLGDPADAAAFARLFFNRALAAATS